MNYPIIFKHDGNGGGYYILNNTQIKNGDKIMCLDTELVARINIKTRKESCHNDSWTSTTYDLVLGFNFNGIKCNIDKSMYGKEIFNFK